MKLIYIIVVSLLLYCLHIYTYIYKKFKECVIKDYRIYNTLREDILVEIETIYHFSVPSGYLEGPV